jgi:hypothetical protein
VESEPLKLTAHTYLETRNQMDERRLNYFPWQQRLVYVSDKTFLYVSASGRKLQFFLYVSATGRNVNYLYVITLYDSANQNFFLWFRPKVAIYAFRTN